MRESEVEGGRESKVVKREGVKWAVGASVHTWSYMFLEKETGLPRPMGDQEAYVCGREMEAIRRG